MKKNKSFLYFIIGTYILFVLMLLITKLLMDGLQNDIITAVAKNICSWAPTLTVIIFFPKLFPGKKRRNFFTSLFKSQINGKRLTLLILLQVVLFCTSIIFFSFLSNIKINQFIYFSIPTCFLSLVNSLTSGATGEEAGWRGYLQPVMVSRHGLIKGSIIVGLVWAFWHAPLWLASGDYTGIHLIQYIFLFVIFVVSLSIIIGISYEKDHNILIPVIMHFIINFTMSFINSNLLDVLFYISLFYLLVAICFIVINTRKQYGILKK